MDLWSRKHGNNRKNILKWGIVSTLLMITFATWFWIRFPRRVVVDSVDAFLICPKAIAEAGVPTLEELTRLEHTASYKVLSVDHVQGMREVSADELMEMESPGPWIFHQSWKDGPLPEHFERWSKQWKNIMGDSWMYVLWRDADNRKLVEKYYPTYLESYDALPKEIYRADMVRNMYMHRFGGIYADLDMVPLTRLPEHLPFLHHRAPTPVSMVYVGHMGDDDYPHSIPNAFMASSAPDHPFWLRPMEYVKSHLADEKYNKQPEYLTGPVALRDCVKEWQKGQEARLDAGEFAEITVLPNEKIYPFSWYDSPLVSQCLCRTHSGHFSEPRCYWLYPKAWTITHWTHSWGS